MLSALNQKLFRDLWAIKGQVAAITLVMAAGIAIFILMFGVLDSLKLTRDTYYERYQFADVFASLKRAPEAVKDIINEIPGVSIVQSRVVFGVTLQMDSMLEPGTGKIISLPDSSPSLLNKLYLRKGRMLFPNEENAILADESFIKAHDLSLGDSLTVIMNGYRRTLNIVGVVLSPEYVYSIAPGALMPDSKRFGVFWMSRRSLEAAVDMKGAFNDISIKTERNIAIEDILSQVDAILKPYGGLISFTREDQLSNFFVNNELKQLQSLGSLAPVIFLSVAAFLINVVMSRQVATQREQIGMLKAVGYTNKEVSLHYLKMVLVITVLGSIIGLALGAWMGAGMTQMYAEFFHFPILKYSFSLEIMILAVFSCTLAAVIGTLFAINKAAKLPPAEAMRPESPATFKVTLLERIGFHQYLSFTSRIILRQIERRPIRTLMSSIGIAFALSILVFSFFMEDSMAYLMDVQYGITQREDVNIGFVEPKSAIALEEIKIIPGVLMVEPLRNVPVYFKHKHFKKRGAITGLINEPILRRVIDKNLEPVNMPKEGIVLNKTLTGILQLKVGDTVEVEILEEKRQRLTIPVSGLTQEYIGLGAYMNIKQLNKILDSTPKITGASLLVDQNHSAQLYKNIKEIPAIIGLNVTSVLQKIFEEIMAENLLKMVATNVMFASFISFGIIYNAARITISERRRELASLRVLGLTRAEVAYILFGELGLITLLSLPIGLFLGYSMSVGMTESMDSELFRIPVYLKNSTYGYAVLIVLLSAVVSFYLVWRQVDSIDLVSAQKGVE